MANKNKIINVAQKHIQRGQYDKAIRELTKLIEEDPKDVRTLLKIGDIYSRKGDKEEATRVYGQVAEFYADQGFFLKAVAVYKQILKYDPERLDVTVKLAELYEHLGLTQEALAQYQSVAKIYDQTGNMRDALRVLSRMVELDPANVASRVRLAESYSRENMIPEAIAEFERAGDTLKGQNRIADYIKVTERLIYHDSSRLDLLKELSRIYLQRNDTRRALAKLQLAFKAAPRDVEVLTLLAGAFQDLGQTPKAVFVYRELARTYQETQKNEELIATYKRILELQPGDAQAMAGLGAGTKAAEAAKAAPAPAPAVLPTVAPPQPAASSPARAAPSQQAIRAVPPAPRAPVAPGSKPAGITPSAIVAEPKVEAAPKKPAVTAEFPARQPSQAQAPAAAAPAAPMDQVAKLLTETDVYIKYGLKEKALEHLKKVLETEPTSTAAFEKMQSIYQSMNQPEGAAEALVNLIREHIASGREKAAESSKKLLEQVAPHWVSRIAASKPAAASKAAAPSKPVVSARPTAPVAPSLSQSVEILASEPPGAYDRSSGVDVDLTSDTEQLRRDGSIETAVTSADMSEIAELRAPVTAEMDAVSASVPAEAFRPSDSPDFGLFDGDKDDDEQEHPEQRMISFDSDGRPTVAELPALEAMIATSTPPPEGPQTAEIPIVALGNRKPAPQPELEDELDGAEFFIQQGLFTEARDVVVDVLTRHPKYSRAVELLARIDLEGPAIRASLAPKPQSIPPVHHAPLSEESAQERTVHDLDAISHELGLIPPAAEFKKPDDAEVPPPPFAAGGDLEARYDLGMAYKEMGMLDEAIVEFQVAAQVPSKSVDAFAQIGYCLMAQGNGMDAVGYFFTAIESGADPKLATALKYEIGTAYQAIGDMDKALHWYGTAYRDDPKFRDLRERIVAAGGNPDEEFVGDSARP